MDAVFEDQLFLGLTESELDAELSLDDPILRESLSELLAPPDDLTDRVAQRVAASVLRRDSARLFMGLMTLAVPTAKLVAGPEQPTSPTD